jgi:outer membrane protein assembly factor BamB
MLRRVFALIVVLVLTALPLLTAAQAASPVPSAGGDWPQYRGNAARSGATTAPGPGPAAVVGWRLTVDGLVAPPVVAAGTLYVGGDLGRVQAIDATTGVERTLFTARNGGLPAPAGLAVADGAVFALALDGTLRVVDLATGGERWHRRDLVTSAAPVVAGGTVYLADATGSMLALDAATGAQRWRSVLGSGISFRSAAALAAGLLVVGERNGTLEALDAATGARRWTSTPRYAIPGGVLSTPTIVGGVVYDVEYKLLTPSLVVAVDAATGAERWSMVLKEEPAGAVAVAGGLVYAGTLGGDLLALDAASGAVRWRLATGNQVVAPPVVAAGTVYAVNRSGVLVAVDAGTGSEEWRLALGEPVVVSPAVADGALYVTTQKNRVVAVVSAAGSGGPTGTPAG